MNDLPKGECKSSENDKAAKFIIKRRKPSTKSDVKNVGGFPVAVIATCTTSHKELDLVEGTNSSSSLLSGVGASSSNSDCSNAQQEQQPLSPEKALRLYRKRFKRRSSDNGSVPVEHSYDRGDNEGSSACTTTAIATSYPSRHILNQQSSQQHHHHQHDDHLIEIPEACSFQEPRESINAESSNSLSCCQQRMQEPEEEKQEDEELSIPGDETSSTLKASTSSHSLIDEDSGDTDTPCSQSTCSGSSSITMGKRREIMTAAFLLFYLTVIYSPAGPWRTRDADYGQDFSQQKLPREDHFKHNQILVFNDDNDQNPLHHTIIPKNHVLARDTSKDSNNDSDLQDEPEGKSDAASDGANIDIVYAKEQVDRQTIIRGEQVTNAQEEYPYVVSLLQRNWKGQAWHTCGGIMISPNVVLTVAHCEYSTDIVHIGLSKADHSKDRRRRRLRGDVDDDQDQGGESQSPQPPMETEQHDKEELFDSTSARTKRSLSSDGIQLHNLRNNNQFGRAYAVKSWHKIKHPKFDSKTGDYDFMLIKVPGWNDNVPTVRINDSNSKPNGVLGEEAIVLGWGVTKASDGRSVTEVLHRASLRVMTNYRCGDMYKKIFSASPISESMVCAYSENRSDACQGDSGGPLILEHPHYRDKDVAVGLVSWGEDCGNIDYPGVYSRISKVHDWITDTVCSKMSPESCSNYEIRTGFSAEEVCKDHIGTFENSRYRSCSWVRRAKWITCRWYKDLCPVTCDVDKC